MKLLLPPPEREWIRYHLRRLGYPNLKAYYQSERWKQRRARYYREQGYRCRKCGATSNLNLNHKTYAHLGYEYDGDLESLCESTCHYRFHVKWTKRILRDRQRIKKKPLKKRGFWSTLFFG